MLDMTLTIPASPDVLAQLVSNRQTWLQSIPQASPRRQQTLQALCDALSPVEQLNEQLKNSDPGSDCVSHLPYQKSAGQFVGSGYQPVCAVGRELGQFPR